MPVALRDKWPTDLTAGKEWFQAIAPCFEGHRPQRGQGPLLSQLQQSVCGADNTPFRLHLFEAP